MGALPARLRCDWRAAGCEREALGRSRGGFGTKVCVIADSAGRAVALALAPGQAHEPPTPFPCSPACRACRSGWSGIAVTAAMLSGSTSGPSVRSPRSRPKATRLPSPALVDLAVKDDETSRSALAFLKEAAAFPFRFTHVLTDNGSCFTPGLARACAALGAEHRNTKPRCPQTNGWSNASMAGSAARYWRSPSALF